MLIVDINSLVSVGGAAATLLQSGYIIVTSTEGSLGQNAWVLLMSMWIQVPAFNGYTPLAWNDLPVAVRVSIARNRNSYRTLIKTHLFNLAIK